MRRRSSFTASTTAARLADSSAIRRSSSSWWRGPRKCRASCPSSPTTPNIPCTVRNTRKKPPRLPRTSEPGLRMPSSRSQPYTPKVPYARPMAAVSITTPPRTPRAQWQATYRSARTSSYAGVTRRSSHIRSRPRSSSARIRAPARTGRSTARRPFGQAATGSRATPASRAKSSSTAAAAVPRMRPAPHRTTRRAMTRMIVRLVGRGGRAHCGKPQFPPAVHRNRSCGLPQGPFDRRTVEL